MVRLALWLTLAATACTPGHAPAVRSAGKWSAIGGVSGLIATAVAAQYTTKTRDLVFAFSFMSAGGVVLYAIGETSMPPEVETETLSERHTRWAKILTERAMGAAREGHCARVQRLQPKIRGYDPEVHDFVFMSDPEIVKCLSVAPATPTTPHEVAPEADLPDADATVP
jgi:hypothetical protein